jgi:hypothetical protein
MLQMPQLTADAAEAKAFTCDCCDDVSVGLLFRVPDIGPDGETVAVSIVVSDEVARQLVERIPVALDAKSLIAANGAVLLEMPWAD